MFLAKADIETTLRPRITAFLWFIAAALFIRGEHADFTLQDSLDKMGSR